MTSDRSQMLNDKEKFHSQVKREQDFHSRRNCTAETWHPTPMIPVSSPRRYLHLNCFFTQGLRSLCLVNLCMQHGIFEALSHIPIHLFIHSVSKYLLNTYCVRPMLGSQKGVSCPQSCGEQERQQSKQMGRMSDGKSPVGY